MGNSKENRLKKVLESAEHEAEVVGHEVKKGTDDVGHVIKKVFTRNVKKQEKQ